MKLKIIELMAHTVGLNRRKMPYRNYFNTNGKSKPWEYLVDRGYAWRRKTSKEMGKIYYHLTEKGLQFILKHNETFGLDKRIKRLETLTKLVNE